MRSHLRSPDEMNWSNTTCAPLAKSPNCASQSVSAFGRGERIAIFETEHGLFRKHRIDDFVARLRRRKIGERDVALFGLLVVEHRVALREGAALPILAGEPDLVAVEQSAPKASASAIAQSMPSPVSIMSAPRFSMKRWIVLCALKPAGISESFLPISFSVFIGTAVLPRRCSSALSAVRRPDHAPSSQSALFGL